jgi:hypothetical protein
MRFYFSVRLSLIPLVFRKAEQVDCDGHDDDGSRSYGLLLAFDSDDPEFARGVEIGILFERLERDGCLDHQTVTAANAEMVIRLAEAKGLPFRADALGDGWLSVSIGEGARHDGT